MSDREAKDSERYYLAYRRSMVVGLVFVVCLGGYMLVDLFRPASATAGLGGLLIGAGYLAFLLIVNLVTLRGRLWHNRGAGERTVMNDEWTRVNRSRAFQIGFWAMVGVQVPMMFVMAYAPSIPEKGAVGMATMTMLVGLVAFFGSFLYYSRQPRDG